MKSIHSRFARLRFSYALALISLTSSGLLAATNEDIYREKIAPVLAEKCASCHSGATPAWQSCGRRLFPTARWWKARAYYEAIHNAFGALLVRRWALPRNGRRPAAGGPVKTSSRIRHASRV